MTPAQTAEAVRAQLAALCGPDVARDVAALVDGLTAAERAALVLASGRANARPED